MEEKRSSGFTLIEMLVTIAILGILVSIGLPSFRSVIAQNRLTAQANDFITALHTARSEAIRRGAPVCVKRQGTTTSDWSNGWKIFVDGNSSRTVSTANYCGTEGDVLQTSPALSGGNTLKSNTNFDTAVRFNALGVATNNGDTGIAGTFKLCRSDSAEYGKTISITTTGMVSVSQANSTCP